MQEMKPSSWKNGALSMAILSTIALSACSSSKSDNINSAFDFSKKQAQERAEGEVLDLQAYCPKLVLRGGTENFRIYAKGTDKDSPDAKNNVVYQATMTDTVRECKRANEQMTIRVGAAGRLIAGPKGGPGTFNMPIRVAVTRGTEVLYSQLHQFPGAIPEGRVNNTFTFVDENVVIPIPDKKNILVFVGFDEGPKKKPDGGS